MHKLMGKVKEEIDNIVECDLTPESLVWLGELVDIAKDVENIHYWENEVKADSIEELIGELMKAYRVCEDEPTPSNKAKLAEIAWCLISKGKQIKECLHEITLGAKEMSEMNRVFK